MPTTSTVCELSLLVMLLCTQPSYPREQVIEALLDEVVTFVVQVQFIPQLLQGRITCIVLLDSFVHLFNLENTYVHSYIVT